MEEEFEQPHGRVLLVGNEVFKLYRYRREEELENRVSELVRFIFGPETVYFDIRQRMKSKAKRINVTDGILLQLKKEKSKLWIVEHELSSHDLYLHVQPQIMGFIRSLRNPQTLRNVQLALYEEIQADKDKEKVFQEFLGAKKDMFFFLDRVLHSKCGVIIVIDEVTAQLMEICEDFARYADVKVIEFKTYQREGKEIYYFTPFSGEEAKAPSRKGRIEYPDYMKDWKARLEWVNPNIRILVDKLIEGIEDELPGIVHMPKYRWHYFYRHELGKHDSIFAAIILNKQSLYIRIRVNPNKLDDKLNLAKQYKGWFFRAKGEERGFSIRNLDQITYALQLIKQAHNYAKNWLEADEQLRETHKKNIIWQKQYEIGLQKTRGGLRLWDWCNRYLYDPSGFSLKL